MPLREEERVGAPERIADDDHRRTVPELRCCGRREGDELIDRRPIGIEGVRVTV